MAVQKQAVQKQDKRRRKQLAEALQLTKNISDMERFWWICVRLRNCGRCPERWYVAKLLDKGKLSYRDINAQTGVSTTTIGRVARFLNEEPHQGYRTVLDRQKEE